MKVNFIHNVISKDLRKTYFRKKLPYKNDLIKVLFLLKGFG
jgi:hypothetical protein